MIQRILITMLHLFLPLIIGQSGVLHAKDTYTKEHPLIIASDWDKPPYEFRNDKAEPAGYYVDVLTAILDELNIPYQFQMMEAGQAIDFFKKGKADLLFDNVRKYKEPEYVHTSNIVSYYRISVATAKDSAKIISLKTLDNPEEVVFYHGGYAAEFFRREVSGHQNINYRPPKEALAGIVKGTYKYFVWNEAALQWKIKELNLEKEITLHEVNIPVGEIHIIGHDSQLIEYIDDQFSRLKQSGKLEEIYNKWFHQEMVNNEDNLPIAIWIVGGVLVLVLMVYLITRLAKAHVAYNLQKREETHEKEVLAMKVDASHGICPDMEDGEKDSDIQRRFNSLFNSSNIAISVYDREGWSIMLNQKMKELCECGNPENERYWLSINMHDIPLFRDAYPHGSTHQLSVCQTMNYPSMGINKRVEIHIYPVADEHGSITQYICTAYDLDEVVNIHADITAKQAVLDDTAQKIEQHEQRLHHLLSDSHIYIFDVDLKTRIMNFSHSLSHTDYTLTMDEYLNMVDAEEQEDASKQLADYEGMNTLVRDFKYTFASPKPQWICYVGRKNYDEQGNHVGYTGIAIEITDLIESQKQLRETTEIANDSIRLKNVFLASMTHELRTPLNAIVGFATVLKATDEPEERKELIDIINSSCDMLQRLINDILEASSITKNLPSTIQPSHIDFVHEFENLCFMVEYRIKQAGLEFIRENPYENFYTTIDIGRVQQIVTNFVTNAVKFTQQGHIRLGYRYEQHGLYIYCEDTGAGVPEDKQEVIFERFIKLDEFIQGTGMGLAICKALTERMGGKIGIDSQGLGKGSTFWIWLPCERRLTPKTEVVEEKELKSS